MKITQNRVLTAAVMSWLQVVMATIMVVMIVTRYTFGVKTAGTMKWSAYERAFGETL